MKAVGRLNTIVYVGWLPLAVLPEGGEFEEEFILGPGNTLNGKPLVDLSEQQNPIVVQGKVVVRDAGERERQVSVAQPSSAVVR